MAEEEWAMSDKSDTPRTDAEVAGITPFRTDSGFKVVAWDDYEALRERAKKIERELAEKEAALNKALDDLAQSDPEKSWLEPYPELRRLREALRIAEAENAALRERHAHEMARFGNPTVAQVVSMEDCYYRAHEIIDATPSPYGLRVVIAAVDAARKP